MKLIFTVPTNLNSHPFEELGTTNYLYDGFNLLEEVDGSGNVLARYTQGPSLDEPLSMLRGGATSYYQVDAVGSVSSLSNGTGGLANTYSYDSYGKLTASTGAITNPCRYTSREFDSEAGIYEYRARYYDQNVGRFSSEDPARFNGPNFYAYVKNSPVGKFDPTGLATCDYYIQGPDGNGWVYCSPDDQRHAPVSFPAASGNNGDPQHHCKNNPDCASQSGTGPIPPGRYRFSTDVGTHKHGGTLLIPDDPAAAYYYRDGLLTHFCMNPFGPSRNKPFCSAGCITASEDNINALNDLISSEPNNTMTVYTELPLQ
jgi:RHS repeat-associated protein